MNLNWVKWWKFLFIIRQPQRFWKKRGCDSLSANLPPCFVPSRITNNWKTHLSQRQCHIRFYHVPQDVLFLFLTTNMDPYHRLFKHSHISHLHMLHLEKKNKMRAKKRLRHEESQKFLTPSRQDFTFLPEAFLHCRWDLRCSNFQVDVVKHELCHATRGLVFVHAPNIGEANEVHLPVH